MFVKCTDLSSEYHNLSNNQGQKDRESINLANAELNLAAVQCSYDYFSYVVFFNHIAPFRAPNSVTVLDSSSTSLLVKWNHLPKVDFQGQPIGYNVTYCSDDLECNMNFVSVNFTTNTTTLSNLTVYTMYIVNVLAVSSGGIGPESAIKARTGAEGTNVFRIDLYC